MTVLVLVAGGATARAVDLRHQHRQAQERAAKALADKRAVAAYRLALRPSLDVVFDAVQPLRDVDDSSQAALPAAFEARLDVLAKSGAGGALGRVRTVISKVPVPSAMKRAAADLDAAVVRLRAAADSLAAGANAAAHDRRHLDRVDNGYLGLAEAESDWRAAVGRVYGLGAAIPTPSDIHAYAYGRAAPTTGSFIAQSDVACGRSALEIIGLGDIAKDRETYLRQTPKFAAALRSAARRLQAVRPSRADADAVHRRIGRPLRGVERAAADFDTLVSAARAGDLGRIRATGVLVREDLLVMDDLARAYTAYGVSVCAELFRTSDAPAQTPLKT